MLTQASYTIHARAWLAWTILLLTALPLILAQILSPTDDKRFLPFIILIIIFCSILYATTKKIKIYIDEDKMVISDLLKKKTILWTDISSSDISWSAEGSHSISLNWIFKKVNNKSVEIRLGYYSRIDMTILANQLIEKAKDASISKKIYNIAEGKFLWYLI